MGYHVDGPEPRQTPPESPRTARAATGGSRFPAGPARLGSTQGIFKPGSLRDAPDSGGAYRAGSLGASLALQAAARRRETLEGARELREYLRGDPGASWEATRGSEWDRIERCIEGSYPRHLWCAGCGRYHTILEGSCKGRICPLCRERYGHERAQTYRDRLGPADHLWYLVATVPPEWRSGLVPGQETLVARRVERAILAWFAPLVPAGILVLHWSGDRDPRTAHPHWNLVISNRLWSPKTGKLVRVRDRTVDLWTMRQLGAAMASGMGCPPSRSRCWMGYKAGHAHQRHCLRYVLRAQGCGDPVARAMWTMPRARHNRPIGMLAPSRLKKWLKVNGWRSPDQRAAALGAGEADPRTGIVRGQSRSLCPHCGTSTREVGNGPDQIPG